MNDKYLETKCDNCGEQIVVNRKSHDGHHCVLSMCDECAGRPMSTEVESYSGSYCVVGVKFKII